jgi:hypothetical protein
MHFFPAYLRTVIICVSAILLVVAAANVLVNPFALFPVEGITGFNQRKTEFFKHVRLVKAYEMRRIQSDVLLLGNSRVDMALDPTHAALQSFSGKAYNAALTGGTLYESLRYLQHAHALRPTKLAVLGLDKGMFESLAQPDFDEGILSVTTDGRANGFPASNLIRTTLSLDTLSASWQTVRRQPELFLREFRADGMRMPENADQAVQREGGYRSVFGKTLIKSTEVDSEAKLAAERKRAFVHFRHLLDFCRAQKIDLRLYIHPVHAWTEENNFALGRSAGVENWKRELVNTISEEAGATKPPFPLWDFSGYNKVTTEIVPSGDATRMQYYWEPLHYTNVAGNLVLNRMFDFPGAVPADFGVLLSEKNINEHSAKSRLNRQRYVDAFSGDVLEIQRIVTGKSK